MVITRARRKRYGEPLVQPTEKAKKVYPYVRIQRQDESLGYPKDRFLYTRKGSRFYFPKFEDLPEEIEFYPFISDAEKEEAMQRYQVMKNSLKYLPSGVKPLGDLVKSWFFVPLGSTDTAEIIPDKINDALVWMLFPKYFG